MDETKRIRDLVSIVVGPFGEPCHGHGSPIRSASDAQPVQLFPREQTLIVGALDEMKPAANRSAFIKYSIPANDPVITHLRQFQAEMYAGYNRTIEPVKSFVPLGQFVSASTGGGKLVLNVPLDYLVWTENIAKFIDAANFAISKKPGVTEKHLWVTGSVSPVARYQLIQRG